MSMSSRSESPDALSPAGGFGHRWRSSGNGTSSTFSRSDCQSSSKLLVCWVCGSATRVGAGAVLVVLAWPDSFNFFTLVCTYKHTQNTHTHKWTAKKETLTKQYKITNKNKEKPNHLKRFSHIRSLLVGRFFPLLNLQLVNACLYMDFLKNVDIMCIKPFES